MTSILRTEIFEQGDALARFLDAESANVARIAKKIRASNIESITIAARGTSDNAGMYGKYVFAAFNHLPVALATPSLYTVYQTPPQLKNTLVIGISQSGESPDILAVLQEAKKQNTPTLAITNSEGSPLAQVADDVILQHAGVEKTVGATKTYTTQLGALALLSVSLANDAARRHELDAVPDAVRQALQADASAAPIAARWRNTNAALVIGRGYNYATAFEIALKLKELTYVLAEPFSSADFMHGPIAVVQDQFPVIVIAPQGQVSQDLFALARDLRERGADVATIADDPSASLILPTTLPEWLSPIPAVVPGQLLAMHLTIAKGFDPDHPRGLKKVTRTL